VDELSKIVDTFARRDLRDTWQARLLLANRYNDRTGMVLLSIIATNYDELTLPLLKAFGLVEPPLPCLSSSGKIGWTGAVFAEVLYPDRLVNTVFYASEIELRDDFRRLADKAKLTDAERIEMFEAIRKWIIQDRRLDPTMDPNDPDAKRLVH